MDMMQWWLIKLAAIQVVCLVVAGYGICNLAKKRLVPAKAKVPARTLVRVKNTFETGILLR